MNSKEVRIIVIGAGASGLAFALACIAQGVKVRIVDRRPTRSMIAKATGVAQGVWNQLAPFGITAAVISAAIPMRNFVFYDDGKIVANVPVPNVHGNPPAHLYPQGELERHMESALNARGVVVEYGTTFEAFEQSDRNARVTLRKGDVVSCEVAEVDWVIGADGARSEVRNFSQLPFNGRDYPEDWSVAEVSTSKWPSDIQAQLYLRSTGVGLFLSQPSTGVVQGILNSTGAAAELKKHFSDAEVRYERTFRVSLRRVSTPRSNRIWLIGDAAHVQSPVGGQGLNLAIWDGITLGQALVRGEFTVEQRLRARARRVLFFTDFDYRMLSTRVTVVRFARNRYWSLASRHPTLAKWFFRLISGV